jgi:hypothetical protein
MPTPTQINTDDIRELKASNQRIEGRFDKLIDELHGFRVEVSREFGVMRSDIKALRSEMETWLSVAKWAVGAIVLGFTLIDGLAFNTSREVAKLDARMTSFETTSRTLQSSMEKLTDALREKAENVRPNP